MMPSVARVTLIGHLGRDPEQKETPTGHSVTELALATNDSRDKGAPATWWRVSVWGKQGDNVARYLKKGSVAFVEGEVVVREWQGKDGTQRMGLNVNASSVTFLPNGDRQQPQEARQAPPPPQPVAAPQPTDDLPF